MQTSEIMTVFSDKIFKSIYRVSVFKVEHIQLKLIFNCYTFNDFLDNKRIHKSGKRFEFFSIKNVE